MWKVTEDDKVVWQLNRDETQGADQLAVIEYSPGMSADELYTHVVQAKRLAITEAIKSWTGFLNP